MQFNIDLFKVKEQENNSSVEESITDEVLNESEAENTTELESETSRKFNINLSDVKESEEFKEILEDFDIGDEISESFTSALGAGIGVNAFINDNVLNEARAVLKTVVRKGKLVQKVVCPPGYKANKGTCERKTAKDVIAFAKRAKMAAKTRRTHKGSAKASAKSRSRSLLIRSKNATKVNRLKSI